MKKNKSENLFVRIDKELKDKLFRYANRAGIAASTFVRKAISNKLKRAGIK